LTGGVFVKSNNIDNLFKNDYKSFEELVDCIHAKLHCPITIEDANHRLLAYSAHDLQTDSARIETIISRHVPEKVINQLWKTGVIPALLQSDNPVRVKEINEVGLGDRVAIAIRKNNEVLGFIWVLEVEHSIKDKDMEVLIAAAEAAKKLFLQLDVRKYTRGSGHQEFFLELLSGFYKTEKDIIKRLQSLKINHPSVFAIVVLDFQKELDKNLVTHINYLLQTSQKLKIIFHTIDQHRIILLGTPLSGNASTSFEHFINNFIQQMKKRFDCKQVYGSYGSLYENLQKIEKSYQEALMVLKIKDSFPDETSDILGYKDLGAFRFLETLAEEQRKEDYENTSLQKLREYDKRYNSFLVDTLEVYLNKDSNPNETAKTLHIHVNTLNYRLKRIVEIGEINLKDPIQKISLYLDIKISKLPQDSY